MSSLARPPEQRQAVFDALTESMEAADGDAEVTAFLDALATAGYHVVQEGQAVVGGRVWRIEYVSLAAGTVIEHASAAYTLRPHLNPEHR